MSLMLACWLSTVSIVSTASAAEVVWLDPQPLPEDVARIAALAGARRAPIDADTFRYAATDFSEADAGSWAALEAALRDARGFETRLDGELVILRDLTRPIAQIGLLRDDADRERLYAALAYQGFAVDRFFDDTLATDPRAVDVRELLPDGTAVPLPWLDAMALDPARVPTPYEIAEAPQRAHYAAAREHAAALLPGLLVVDGGLPKGAALVVDGRPVPLDAASQVRLPPGRHLAYVSRGGHVLARADFRLEAAGSATIRVPLGDAAWAGWLDDLRDDGIVGVPEPLWPTVRAYGGELVVAWRADDGPHASRLTEAGTTPITLPPAGRAPSGARTSTTQLQLALGLGGGWLESGDFYLQDPASVPRTKASVNAGTLDAVVDLSVQVRAFRASVIGDLGVPFGDDHVALTGAGAMRPRPDVSLGLGVKWAQATVGFLFPYHPTVGARLTIPVWKGLEVLASARAGIPTTLHRDDDSAYTTRPTGQAWAGIGWRFGWDVGRGAGATARR